MKSNNKQARYIALEILMEVNSKERYANISLKEALKKHDLSDRDRAFVTQLVYGTLEKQITIDYSLKKTAKIKKTNPWILNILRLSIYQIMYLDRVPDSAAVNEAVKLCKKRGLSGLRGFVNGVLRNIVRNKDRLKLLDENEKGKDRLALRYGYPVWLAQKWIDDYGEQKAELIMRPPQVDKAVSIRVNTHKATSQEVRNRLAKIGITAESGFYLPEALRIKYAGDIEKNDLYKKGLFTVQGESSMLVSHILAPSPGELILDGCSSPGGKAIHMSELMNNRGRIDSWDIHKHRVKLIDNNVERMGTKIVHTKLMDASVYRSEIDNKMDRVLLDVPCSGLGTINKKPDIKLRTTLGGIDELVKLQRSILHACSRYVKPGGVLVYSTCTINPDENQLMIKSFLHENQDFFLDDISPYLPAGLRWAVEDNMIQTIPLRDNIDGFFIARVRKKV
ncbi:MAG TPA: 16S rRNA (cytosine(967)-C(5))-methyltransferase RsmB [Bacillota bacterium]|nr:16S rRNA (cytosine(967)-C(5))-methyltransferase RsmB [Bacillota bacterium]